MKKLEISLLLIILIFTVLSTVQAAEKPIIVYSLKFVELDAASIQSFKGKLKVEEGESSDKWQIISTDQVLEYVHNNGQQSSLAVKSAGEQEQSRIYYDSWLTTIGKQSASVELKERLVGLDGKEGGSYLQLHLQPLQIDQKQDRIKTRIKFKQQGKLGAKAKTETKVWVSSSGGQPIAIVAQKATGDNRQSRRYFALYVTGKIASEQHLDKKAAMVAMGNLQEMNNLFGGEVGPKRDQKELGLYAGLETYGIKAEWRRVNYKLYGEVNQENGQLIYKTEFDYNLWGADDLFLATRIENRTTVQSDPVFRLGLQDQVTWKDAVKLQAVYFPVYRGLGAEVETNAIGEASLKFQQPQWSIWYTGEWRNSNYFNGGGLSYNFTDQWQLAGEWDQNHQSHGKIYLGVVWDSSE